MNCEQLANWNSPPGAAGTIPSLAVWAGGEQPWRQQPVPEEVRRRIRRQAAQSSPRQLGDVIAATLIECELDWRRISLDDMKSLVLEAVLASRVGRV